MRLIDAEEARNTARLHAAYFLEKRDYTNYSRFINFASTIEQIDTIEAIPVKWLEDFAKRAETERDDCAFMDEWDLCNDYAKLARTIVRTWRKENEIN